MIKGEIREKLNKRITGRQETGKRRRERGRERE